jgi:hypothetical protein
MVPAVFSIAKAEVRMTLRNLGFWFYLFFVTLIVNLIFVYSYTNPLRETIVKVVSNVLFFQFPLLAIVITPALARHQHSSREWIWATQIDYPLLLAGQILGFILLFSFVIVFIPCLVTFAWIVFEKSSFIDFVAVGKIYHLLLLPVTFLEISIIVSVTCLARNSMSGIAFSLATTILTWLGVLMPSASLLTPLNYTLLGLYFDPVAGLGAEKKLIETLVFFYFSTGLLSLSMSVLASALLFSRERTKSGSKSFLMVLLGFSAGTMFLAYSLYWLEAKQRTVPPPPSQIQTDTWKLVSDSHIGSIADNQLKLASKLTILNASSDPQTDLFLSLNQGLTCDKAKVNNETALCEREGEFVRIPLPMPVKPNQKISVEAFYQGKLILLREDYSLADTIRGYSPPSFQNPVYSYLQNDILYLHRDGNWKVHPLSSFSHIGATTITLSVPVSSQIFSSGEIIEQNSSHITYQWRDTLPQILLVSAPYIEIPTSNDKIFLGVYSDKSDLDKAVLLLTFKKSLDSKFSLITDSQQTVIMLPYAQELIFSDSIIGLPAKYRNQTDVNAEYLLARDASFAWLIDHISWPHEINTVGYLRSFEIVCDKPDERGYQECRKISLGNYNLQAPQRRVIYQIADNNVLYALQTILALDLLKSSVQNESFVKREYENWLQKAECNNETIIPSADILKARWVVGIYRLFNRIGEDGASKLLSFLAEKYKPGSPALTEQEFLQTIESFQYTQNYLPEFRAVLSCNMSDNLMEEGK